MLSWRSERLLFLRRGKLKREQRRRTVRLVNDIWWMYWSVLQKKKGDTKKRKRPATHDPNATLGYQHLRQSSEHFLTSCTDLRNTTRKLSVKLLSSSKTIPVYTKVLLRWITKYIAIC